MTELLFHEGPESLGFSIVFDVVVVDVFATVCSRLDIEDGGESKWWPWFLPAAAAALSPFSILVLLA